MYDILNKVLSYIKEMDPSFKLPRTPGLPFRCPSCKVPDSAILLDKSFLIKCNNPKCKKDIGTIIDVVRLLEPQKANFSDQDILDYLAKKYNITYTVTDNIPILLDYYERNGFDLVPVASGQKIPVERDWTNKSHKEKWQWENWLEDGLNIGVKTGKMSGVTVIDVDIDPIPEELLALLGPSTLFQKTGKGTHYFYKYEPSLPKTRIVDLHTDIENNGGQVIVAPSVVAGHKRTIELYDVQPMPEELKKFLLNKTRDKSAIAPIPAVRSDENIQWDDIHFEGSIKEGNRHLNFMKFGGILRKKMNLSEVAYTLSMVNKFLCDPPLTNSELQNIVNSINKYTHLDEKDLAYKILDYIDKVEEASARDVREALEFRKEHIDLALSSLVREGYLIRTRRFFKVIKKLPWKDEWFDEETKINYIMPYFNDLHVFREGDLMIIGAKTGCGKTHVACNVMKRLIEQGIKPKYVNLESANRFLTIAKKLGLKEGDFDWAVNYSPETMELDDRSFTIIDWLLPNDYAVTDKIYKYFSEQLARHKGILCIFVQLKSDDNWFAPNQIEMFPSFAAKFVYEDQLGEKSKFIITKIREAKSKNRFSELKMVYDWGSRELLTELEHTEKNGLKIAQEGGKLESVDIDDKFNLKPPDIV